MMHAARRPPDPLCTDPGPSDDDPTWHRPWRVVAAVVLVVVGSLAAVMLTAPTFVDKLITYDARPAFGVRPAGAAVPTVSAAPVTMSPTAPVSSPPTPPPTSAAPVLRMSGPVPSAGSGTFGYASGQGEVLGRSGPVWRYRVAVETGSGVAVDEFAGAVDLVLGDPRSWIASGRLRLRRVPGGARHDFTIYLATARTAARMCAAGGVDIRVDGEPYTSCRSGNRVVINLNRWLLSVDHFVAARIPLATYREYVINHEVGHALGHQHERCPGKGRPAPTMMKQTLYLGGCSANPWPYVNGERYAGPPL